MVQLWVTECISDVFGNAAGYQAGEALQMQSAVGPGPPMGSRRQQQQQHGSLSPNSMCDVCLWTFFRHVRLHLPECVKCVCVCVHVQRHCECHC